MTLTYSFSEKMKAAMAEMARMVEDLERELSDPNSVTEKQRPKVERQILSIKKTIAREDPQGAGARYLPLLSVAEQKRLLVD